MSFINLNLLLGCVLKGLQIVLLLFVSTTYALPICQKDFYYDRTTSRCQPCAEFCCSHAGQYDSACIDRCGVYGFPQKCPPTHSTPPSSASSRCPSDYFYDRTLHQCQLCANWVAELCCPLQHEEVCTHYCRVHGFPQQCQPIHTASTPPAPSSNWGVGQVVAVVVVTVVVICGVLGIAFCCKQNKCCTKAELTTEPEQFELMGKEPISGHPDVISNGQTLGSPTEELIREHPDVIPNRQPPRCPVTESNSDPVDVMAKGETPRCPAAITSQGSIKRVHFANDVRDPDS